MRRASMVVTALFLACLFQLLASSSIRAFAGQPQSTADEPKVAHPVHARFRPKLALQKALQIAETYIETEHVDISSYWLYSAKYALIGDEKTADKDKLKCWQFLWINDEGTIGDDVEILVTMDGKAWRYPSM